jgi:hypothetical protein
MLCNSIGQDMDAGILTPDWDMAGEIIKDTALRNGQAYFRFPESV